MSEVLAGQKILADHNNDLNSPGWTSYTLTWTSDLVAPTIVNGTRVAAYRKSENSDLIHARFKFTRGASDTNGTGSYFFGGFPAAAASEVGNAIGVWYMLDVGTGHYSGTLHLQSTTTVLLVRDSGVVSAGSPITLATGDVISGRLWYEPA